MLKKLWSFAAIAVIIITSIISSAPPLVFAATVVGIVFVLAAAFKHNSCPLLGAILSGFYAYFSYQNGFFANAALNATILIPIQLVGWYWWVKKGDLAFVLNSVMKKWIGWITVLGIVSSTVFSYHTGSHLWFLDGPSAFICITGTVLLSLKAKEQWYAWIPYNILECVMWFFAMSLEPSVIAIFAMRVVFFINSVIGAKEWFGEQN